MMSNTEFVEADTTEVDSLEEEKLADDASNAVQDETTVVETEAIVE